MATRRASSSAKARSSSGSAGGPGWSRSSARATRALPWPTRGTITADGAPATRGALDGGRTARRRPGRVGAGRRTGARMVVDARSAPVARSPGRARPSPPAAPTRPVPPDGSAAVGHAGVTSSGSSASMASRSRDDVSARLASARMASRDPAASLPPGRGARSRTGGRCRRPRRRGRRSRRRSVRRLGEPADLGVAEEQPAEDLASGHDRHGQVAAHREVARRHPVIGRVLAVPGVGGDVVEPDAPLRRTSARRRGVPGHGELRERLGGRPRQRVEHVGLPARRRHVVEEGAEAAPVSSVATSVTRLDDLVGVEVGGQHRPTSCSVSTIRLSSRRRSSARRRWARSASLSRQVTRQATLIPVMNRAWTPAHLHGWLRPAVVEDGIGVERAEEPVVDEDVADGGQERQPVLVQRDDNHHHEEVEVHLDHAAGEVHEHRRRRQQAEAGHHGAAPAGEPGAMASDGGGVGTTTPSTRAWTRREAHGQGDDRDEGGVEPEHGGDAPVPDPPDVVGEAPALGQDRPHLCPPRHRHGPSPTLATRNWKPGIGQLDHAGCGAVSLSA